MKHKKLKIIYFQFYTLSTFLNPTATSTLIPYKFNYTSNTNTNSTLINIPFVHFVVHSYVAKLKL